MKRKIIRLSSIILISLSLAACEDKPEEIDEPPRSDREDRFHIPNWGLPRLLQADIEAVRTGFLEGRCKPLWQNISKDFFITQYPVLAARLVMDGTCGPIKKTAAETWLDQAIYYGTTSPEALYLLGEIKLEGANYPPSKAAANLLFRKAVMVAAPSYFYFLDIEKRGTFGANDPVAWGLKNSEMIRQMATVINEPRKTPPEFKEHLDWLDALYQSRDSEKMVTIAKEIRASKSLGRHSLWSALEWLDYADYKLGSDDAKMTKLRWLTEPNIEKECARNTLTDCIDRMRAYDVFELLLEATTILQPEANQIMRCLIDTVKDAKAYRNLTFAWQQAQTIGKSLRDSEQLIAQPLRVGRLRLRWVDDMTDLSYEVDYIKNLGATLTEKINTDYTQMYYAFQGLRDDAKFSREEFATCANVG